jgi:hypothetical protein
MKVVYIVVVFLLFLAVFMQKNNNKKIAGMSPVSTQPASKSSTYAPYQNQCLTTRPIGMLGTKGAENYWKNQEEHWKVEYAPERISTNMDAVCGSESPLTNKAQSFAARPELNKSASVYHNPPDFCRLNPKEFPCPNSWHKDAGEFKGTLSQQSDRFHNVPAPVDGIYYMRPEFSVQDEQFHL